MENKCLVTKLLGEVSDNSLKKLGEMSFMLKKGRYEPTLAIGNAEEPYTITIENGWIAKGYGEEIISGLPSMVIDTAYPVNYTINAEKDTKVTISNKYSFNFINNTDFVQPDGSKQWLNLSDIVYNPFLNVVGCYLFNDVVDFDIAKYQYLINFSIYNFYIDNIYSKCRWSHRTIEEYPDAKSVAVSGVDFGDELDKFLIENSKLPTGASWYYNEKIDVKGVSQHATNPEVQQAIRDLKAQGFKNITINGVNVTDLYNV